MTPPSQEPLDAELAAAASRRGIDLEYYDVFGRRWTPSRAVIERILAALGPEPDPARIGLVITPGVHEDLPLGSVLRLESGETREVTCLDAALPWGYHQLLRPNQPPVPVAVCPAQMWRPEGPRRAAGVAIALYGLRSRRNWGVGDFRDLADFCRWAAACVGAQFVALNPLHAIHNREPYNTSPYLPLSSYFRNYLYLDIEGLEEFSQPSLQQLYRDPEIQAELARLRAAEFVDYEACAALKLRFLERAFDEGRSAESAAFDQFVREQGPELEQFALFCALDQYFRETQPGVWLWKDWPSEYQDPASAACRQFAARQRRSLRFYSWLQWQIAQQLAAAQAAAIAAGMTIGLYHDLALATDRFGSELWAHRERFVAGCRVGSPPDGFSPEGQDWAFPPPNSSRIAEDGYQPFAATIRQNAMPGGALRLDHVMRLFRLFWIPDGYPAREGTYVREPWRQLLGILALESHRGRFRVIGEDLGTVTDEIRSRLEQSGVLGYRLLIFERDQGRFRTPAEYSPSAVAAFTTHDLPTLSGFWMGHDIEARRAAGLLPQDDAYQSQLADRRRDRQQLLDALHAQQLLPEGYPRDAAAVSTVDAPLRRAVLEFLARTPCELLVVNQEELTGEEHQQNLPGSTSEYPNWKRKMKFALEDLASLDTTWLKDILKATQRLHGCAH